MSTASQVAIAHGQAELCLSGPTIVRNLDVIYFLVNRCKLCGEDICDSPTKPRTFCDNNNVCCNAYSRAKKRGKSTRSPLAVCKARAKRWLTIWERGKAGSTVDNIRVSRDEVICASGRTWCFDDGTKFGRSMTFDRIIESRKDARLLKDKVPSGLIAMK